MMKKMTVLVLAVIMAAAFMACGSCRKQANLHQTSAENVEQTTTTRIPTLSDIYGTWKVTKILDIDVKMDATMTFDKDGHFGAKVCNSMGGKFVQKERRSDALRFEYLSRTQMMGDEDEMKVEDILSQQLDKVRTFNVVGDVLTLSDEDDNVVITAKRK